MICGRLPGQVKSTYSEPTVLWRLRRPPHDEVRVTVVSQGRIATLVRFLNGQIVDCESVATLDEAVTRASALRESLEADGWSEDQPWTRPNAAPPIPSSRPALDVSGVVNAFARSKGRRGPRG